MCEGDFTTAFMVKNYLKKTEKMFLLNKVILIFTDTKMSVFSVASWD